MDHDSIVTASVLVEDQRIDKLALYSVAAASLEFVGHLVACCDTEESAVSILGTSAVLLNSFSF